MEAHTLSGLIEGNRAEVLVNGDQIFPAMLAAIRAARTTITFANFVYEDGAIAREMAEALAERCRAGVGVSVLVDAVGSSKMPTALRRMLSESGCHFARYQPVNPFALKRFNHRNHRRILVVDGRIGFTGGTGIGEKWTGDGRQEGHWRQTDVRVEGPIVRFLQAAFVEDWVSIGSANLDNASFALNNELNVTFLDRRLARRLSEIFANDLKSTTPVTLPEWRRHVFRHLLYLPLVPLRDQL